jgi:hypothetical protein
MAGCPHCKSLERHRFAALVLQKVPEVAPRWFSLADDFTSGRFVKPEVWRPKAYRTKAAYFGPHPGHVRLLRRGGLHVRGLDFFAPGYNYNSDTQLADLSGVSCGGGYGIECVPVKDGDVDLIIILHVLEHVVPVDIPLKQLARIAKPGVGMMQIEVPCEPVAQTRMCRIASRAPKDKSVNSTVCDQPDHMISYNCEEFRGLVEASGWTCTRAGTALIKSGESRESLKQTYGLRSLDRAQFLCRRNE